MKVLPLTVLRTMLSKAGWHGFSHLVEEETFPTFDMRRVFKIMARLHEQTTADLNCEALAAAIEAEYAQHPDLLHELRDVVLGMDKIDLPPQELLERAVQRFIEKARANKLMEYLVNNAHTDTFSSSVVADLASRTVEVSGRVRQTFTDILGAAVSGSPDARPARYGLGFSRELDAGLRGGVGSGELAVVLAGPSRGKTSFLCYSGATHAIQGRGVLHITLEISARKVVERYDQVWTSLDQNGLETLEGQARIRSARDLMRERGGHVWVADWSYMDVNARDIGKLVRRINHTVCDTACGCGRLRKVDTVVIDYLELVNPHEANSNGQARFDYSAVAKQTRALAKALDVPVLTAWQVNRAGDDQNVIDRKHVSESWDIVKIADVIIGLNQTPAELSYKRMRVNILKQREGTNRGTYELYSDLDRMVVRDITAEDHTEALQEILGTTPEGSDAPGD